MSNRRYFIKTSLSILAGISILDWKKAFAGDKLWIQTVTGLLRVEKMGKTLIHEHILVDFIGAKNFKKGRWNKEAVIEKVLPYLKELKQLGCDTLVECTPDYLGRDVFLLKELSEKSGLNILSNTGYYGAGNNKYLPEHAFAETAQELANRWIAEFEKGIEQSGIKPGFIKISVAEGILSELHQKLVQAAALTHLRTGLTIASHTGFAIPAFEQMEVLKSQGVHPEAFIWVHAQNEKDKSTYSTAAKAGAWISLDGLNDKNVSDYVEMLLMLKEKSLLSKTLVSHDAGWYDPDKTNGGEFRHYNTFFKLLIPALKQNGFSKKDIDTILESNPKKAFAIKVRSLGLTQK